MKKKEQPQKPPSKPIFVHDENLEFLKLRKTYNRSALFKSIVKIMKRQGAKDAEVIDECNKRQFHIITHNTKDFINPPQKIKVGIICVGYQTEDLWIPKFSKLFKKYSHHSDYFNKTILMNNNGIVIKDRKTGDSEIL